MSYQITQQQQNEIEEKNVQLYIDELMHRYDKDYPCLKQHLTEQPLRQLLRQTIDQLEQEGITERGPVQFYLDLKIYFGYSFKTDPQYPWINQTIEENDHLTQLDNATVLHEKIMQYIHTIFGKDKQHLISLKQKLNHFDYTRINISPINYQENAYQFLNDFYPQKCQATEKKQLMILIEQAIAKANRTYKLDEPNEIIPVLLLMFLKGHQFDQDPFYVDAKQLQEQQNNPRSRLLADQKNERLALLQKLLKQIIPPIDRVIEEEDAHV